MNIYVGNLSSKVSEDTLKALFEGFGAVSTVKIIKDRFTGEARGFGFVEMGDSDAANKAISEINGQELEGQRLRVNEARPREQRPRTNNFRPRF